MVGFARGTLPVTTAHSTVAGAAERGRTRSRDQVWWLVMGRMRSTLGLAARGLRHARRLIVLVVGSTVLAIGIALIVLPGPAFIVIPVGLGILGTEFLWARRLLQRLKDGGSRLVNRDRGGERTTPPR